MGAWRRADLSSTGLRPTQEAETTGLLIQQMHVENPVLSRGPQSIMTGDGCTWSWGLRPLSASYTASHLASQEPRRQHSCGGGD